MTPPIEQMRAEVTASKAKPPSRILINAKGPGGVKGIVVPRHMLHGTQHAEGMDKINAARAATYGAENRPPLTLGQMGQIHKSTLEDHFSKPVEDQIGIEKDALQKLRAAKHIGKTANTLDKSEKLDTVRHEHDEQGRTYEGFASKGIAGHALYTSGHGPNEQRHVLNTCAGQTEGCGGGTDKNGVVDTSKGTCFAPNAESQYVNAAVRRACHAQAKHDPAMTKDWILAHTGSMREAANGADKRNARLLFRPNVVDETDVSSRHVIRGLNKQREAEGKPPITANSYGKTNEMHDPENGYHVTYSNVGPKTKQGSSIAENIARDKQRVRSTIMATTGKGEDLVNDEGHKTPPKGSYMVTDVKRDSPMAKKMEKTITHAKYWTTGRPTSELSEAEKAEGPSGHFGPNGKPTTPDKAHFGHTTLNDTRYDYQKQHILHPRLVQVGKNEDGTPHMIPTDSRFKDPDFLPKDRFKTKNGKEAGHLLMTTPTTSTSTVQHQSAFTHHVNEGHIEHAKNNNGEYEIDPPHAQEASAGKEYVPPQPIKFMATGGHVAHFGSGVLHPSHRESQFDEYMSNPEMSFAAQFHLAHRHDPEEREEWTPAKRVARKPTRKMADGGAVEPDKDTMLASLMLRKTPDSVNIKNVGVKEAPDLPIKAFVSPNGGSGAGLPIGGVDFQPLTPGNQMMPQQPGQPPGQPPAPPQGAMPSPGAPGAPPPNPNQPQSNILALTRQGQALQAMRPQAMPRQPGPAMPKMARGGQPPVEDMRKALGKFLEGSKVKGRMYHGTQHHDAYGEDDDSAIQQFTNFANWVAKEPHTANTYAGKSGYVMPVHVNIKKPLRLKFDLNGHLDDALKAAKRLGVDTSIYSDDMEPYHVVNSPEFIEAATKRGYDGITAKESGKMTHAVFDPRMIKSAIGNRGTYDPSSPDITMKRGGSTNDIELEERPL